MSIISFNTQTTGLIGQTINPRRCTMVTTDSLATITTAGYLNTQNNAANPIFPTDVFEILYDFNEATQSGTLGFFTVQFSNGNFTLNVWENPGNVLLPVTDGHFAVFNGTSGQIEDAGYLPSDDTLTNVSMVNGVSVVNEIPLFSDANGTITSSGLTFSNPANPKAVTVSGAITIGHVPAYVDTSGSIIDSGQRMPFSTLVSGNAGPSSFVFSVPGAAIADPCWFSADTIVNPVSLISCSATGSNQVTVTFSGDTGGVVGHVWIQKSP